MFCTRRHALAACIATATTTATSESLTMHKHSYSQDSTLSGWSESSSLQPKSIQLQRAGESARSFKKNLFGAGLAFATGVLPVYFLVFAGLAYHYDGSWLENSPVSVWLLEAARFVSGEDVRQQSAPS